MVSRPLRLAPSRPGRGFASSALILVLLGIGLILGLCWWLMSSSAAREEHLRLLGEKAALVARNSVDEAFYAVFTRINSPTESRKFEPDIYRQLRDLTAGRRLEFELKPFLAWRTALHAGTELRPVNVSFTLDRVGTESVVAGSRPASITQVIYGPGGARTTTSPVTGSAAPGLPADGGRRSCYTLVNYVPQIINRTVGQGRLRLSATASLKGGEGLVAERTLTVEHSVRIIQVSANPPLAWVEIAPIQSYQTMERRTGIERTGR